MNMTNQELELLIKNSQVNTNMEMLYVAITPKLAQKLLETNTVNRNLSRNTVTAYARDMENDSWCEETGDAITFNEKGELENGQHRLKGIVLSGKTIKTWVCLKSKPLGFYDSCRKRSNRDQMAITRPDLEAVYSSSQCQTVISYLIRHRSKNAGAKITFAELMDFINEHKEVFDSFFLNFPQSTPAKTGTGSVRTAIFLAYCSGVSLESLISFYEILTTGLADASKKGVKPVIRYRNYLLQEFKGKATMTDAEIKRCQWTISKYVANSTAFQTKEPEDFIYPIPFMEEKSHG